MTVSEEERERARDRSRRMAETDRLSNLATAEQRGKRIGRQERDIEIAQKMLSNGKPVDEIKLYTDLTNEKIEELRIH